MGVIPLFPGLNGSVSVRNFHLDDYPEHTQTETTDAWRGTKDFKHGMIWDMMNAGASWPHTWPIHCVSPWNSLATEPGNPISHDC